jgi:hypothetical protein
VVNVLATQNNNPIRLNAIAVLEKLLVTNRSLYRTILVAVSETSPGKTYWVIVLTTVWRLDRAV